MKPVKRSLFAVSLLFTASGVCAPVLAQADPSSPSDEASANVPVAARARPDYDPIGAHVGAFMIYPEVTFAVDATDNVFASNANKQSDLIFTAAPQVTAQSLWRRHALKIELGATDYRHDKDTQDDHTDAFASADARVDVYGQSSIGFGGSYQTLYEPRTAAVAQTASELVHYAVASGYVLGATTLDRLRLSARGDFADLNYDNVPGFPQDYRDHTEVRGTFRGEYAVSPDTSLVAQASVNKHDYNNSNLGSNGEEFLVGVSTRLTHLINGEVDVGYTTQDYDDPAVGTVAGLAVHGNVQWFPSELTTVTFNASREVSDTGVIGGGGVLTTGGGVRVDHELLRNVILTGGVSDSSADYGGIARHDNWVSADVGATYLMNRHVGLKASYDYTNYDTQDSTAQKFVINSFTLSVTLKL